MNFAPEDKLPELLGVYDRVGDYWVASLPLSVSNLSRLAKFKIARKAAMELCLSSISISLRKNQVTKGDLSSQNTHDILLLTSDRNYGLSREQSPVFSSQIFGHFSENLNSSLPTPRRTPSLYSQSSGVSADVVEDIAISRLRQYADIGSPLLDLPKLRLLSQWPSTAGADPSEFNAKAILDPHETDESGEETEQKKRREESRRRRTEKFLNKQRMGSVTATSQPAFPFFGSQAEVAHHAASSQSLPEIPMTQPDRGAFGSRAVHVDKKRQKKRRAAGF